MPQIPFVGAAYKERSSNFDAQVCINLYPVLGESGTAKSVRALYGTPGTRPVLSTGGAIVRGMYKPSVGDPIVVVDYTVYRMDSSFSLTSVGVIDGTSPVSMGDNGQTAVIVTGTSGYTLELTTNTFTQINDDAFYGADKVWFLDTFGIFNRPGTNQFYITGANEITFDALDFASAESNAEPIVSHVVDHAELILFKQSVTEIWRASGDPDFPFARDTNASIQQGCAAKNSVAQLDNTVFWLGKNEQGEGIVWRLNGYTPIRVSTDAVEFAIASYSDISDAIAYSYQQEGHTFYVLTFPTGNATWVYDAATQLWHQRAYMSGGVLGRHRSNCHLYYMGKHLVGDYADGGIYELDLDYYYDRSADPLPAIRSAAYVADADYGWIPHRCMQVDMETGVGLESGDSATAVLDWSDDGGHTWSNQHEASLGLVGQYSARVRWNRLGRSRRRVYRLTISDPVKRVIIGATLNP